jgi:hypothetical protein
MCVNATHCCGARKSNSLPLHACLYVYASCVCVKYLCVQCVIDRVIHEHRHACTHADVCVCVRLRISTRVHA